MTRPALLAAALLLPLTACSASDGDGKETLTVLAASSLTEVFEELAADFEAEHPDVDVRLSFGSSTTLAQQAADGAPGDLLATADEASMEIAESAGVLSDQPKSLASNEMVLVVRRGNPARITGIDDLTGTDWVRCADDVPCGRVASALVGANDVTAEPVSLEVDVKSVLAKVTAGEADAGLVYSTDARAAGDDVEVIEVPHASEHPAKYYISPLADAESPDLASQFVELLSSRSGIDALLDAGFSIRISG
jgi:molybdate transport system substrate-binding protein